MKIKKQKSLPGKIYYITAGLLLFSFLLNLYFIFSEKSTFTQADGWGIGFGLLALISTLALGVIESINSTREVEKADMNNDKKE